MSVPAESDADAAALPDGRRLILDCCVLLNLYATRRIAEILRTLPAPCAVASIVHDREAMWVGRGPRTGPGADHERVDLAPLVSAGLLEVLSLSADEEYERFVALATSLGDGEAMSGALAHSRQLTVATDDRAAVAEFDRQVPPIRTRSTTSVVKHWARCAHADSPSLRGVLVNIRERGRFEPGPHDPLHGWWRAALAA